MRLKEREKPIDKLVGCGVTAIGSPDVRSRQIFEEQIGVSLAQGKPLFGYFRSKQMNVLILRNGQADLVQTEERRYTIENGDATDGILHIEKSLLRIEPEVRQGYRPPLKVSYDGLIDYLQVYKEKHPNLGIALLGDFYDVRTSLKTWIEKELGDENAVDASDPRYAGYFISERDRHNISSLRNFSFSNDVAVVLGADLNTRGKFNMSDGRGPMYCDNKLFLKEKKNNEWILEVAGSDYVPSGNYTLNYNPFTYFQLSEEEVAKMRDLGLTENDKKVIDAMWGMGNMKLVEIENNSGLGHSTVAQRVKALQRAEKGIWIVNNADKTYRVDETKERPWIESNG